LGPSSRLQAQLSDADSRRRLSLTIAVVAALTIPAWLGLGLAAPPSLAVASSRPSVGIEPPPNGLPIVRLESDALGRAPRRTAPGQPYSYTWLVNGRVQERKASLPISWPRPVAIPAGPLFASFGKVAPPILVDIRLYAGPLDARGMPTQVASSRCALKDPSLQACPRLAGDVGGFLPPSTASPSYVTVFAIWTLPPSQSKQARLPLGVQISGIWLFRIR
jgi:hypothetical protein